MFIVVVLNVLMNMIWFGILNVVSLCFCIYVFSVGLVNGVLCVIMNV